MSINPIAIHKQQNPILKHHSSEADDERHQMAFDSDLRTLHQVAVRMHFARGETIFLASDDSAYVYKVVSGVVRLCKYSIDGRRQIIDFMHAGNFFGLIKLDEYGFNAEAVTDVVLLSYPRVHVERLEATVPAVQRHVSALLSEGLMIMQNHIVVLGCQTAKERVASFLLRLSGRVAQTRGDWLDVSMGRQDIADHLGLTIETVCRALSELKREHLIAIPNIHQVTLSDVSALRDLADGGHDGEAHVGVPHDISLPRNGTRSYAPDRLLLS